MTILHTLLPGLSGTETIHPLLVHFPLGLLLAALALHTLAFVRRNAAWAAYARVCLYLGTLGACVALATGFLEADRLGHDTPGHELVHIHRNFMVVATLLAIATSALTLRSRAAAGRDPAVLVGLILTGVVLTLGADRGGELVFQHGVGVANAALPEAEHGGHDHGSETNGSAPDSVVEPEPAPDLSHESHDHVH